MSLQAIKKIAAIELESEKQRADAITEAKKIVADAEASGRELIQKAHKIADAEVQKIYQAAEAKGKTEAAEISQRMQKECATLETAAASKMDAAVSIIVERVVNG